MGYFMAFTFFLLIIGFAYFLKSGKDQESSNSQPKKDDSEDWINERDNKIEILEFKNVVDQFLKKMLDPKIKPWFEIIQTRSDLQARMCDTFNVKMEDYSYWAKDHLDEYTQRMSSNLKDEDPMKIDEKALKFRIDVFSEIIMEFDIVIKKAIELNLNITNEMANDYHTARASLIAVELALKNLNNKIEMEKENLLEITYTRFFVSEKIYQSLKNDDKLIFKLNVHPNRGKHPNGYYLIPNDIIVTFIEGKKVKNGEPTYNWQRHNNFKQDGIPKALKEYFTETN